MRLKPKAIISFFLITLIGGAVMFGLSGCFGRKYSVDYCGEKDSYKGAKDSYRAGEKVELYYWLIATDTDYSFYLDDERINPDYIEKDGGQFVIRFTMPDHDVKLKCESKNSMEVDLDSAGDMLVDYYEATIGTDGGDSSYELVLSETQGSDARLDVYRESEEGEETCTSYLVPCEAVTKCYEIIDSSKMREWNSKYPDNPLDGAVTAVKFRDDDGSYIRVSTDRMPDDGEEKMDSIKSVLSGYMKDENKI